MRVGVYLSSKPEQSGGGYTFQRAVLAALAAQPINSDITWIPLYAAPTSGCECRHTSGFRPRDLWLQIAREFLRLLVKRSSGLLYPPRIVDAYSKAVARKMGRLKLDFLWCLSPTVPTFELPYAMHAWDFEHRVHPGFPEVGLSEVWSYRDRSTAEAVQRATLIFTGTDLGGAQALKFYGVDQSHVRVVPMPTPDDCLVGGSADGHMHQSEALYFVYPAQFWPHKNHIVLLEALAHLRSSSLPTPKLKFVGSDKGNLQFVMSRAHDLGVADCVESLGFVSRHTLLHLYRGAAGLLYPSLFGPDNIPPLEAMALGVPVVAADVSAMREQLGHCALFVDALDSKMWADAMIVLAEDADARARLIRSGLLLASERSVASYAITVSQEILKFRDLRKRWL